MTVTTERPLVAPTARLLSAVTDSDDPAWHEARKAGLGSSDAAAILGLDPWKSPYSVWLDKTGRGEPVVESEPMRWGKVLEGAIAEEFAVRHDVAVLPAPGILQHVDVPWLLASPDRMVVRDVLRGAESFVEVKNVSAWKGDEWDAEAGVMPLHYMAQIQHQLAVTGYEAASVACLVGGQRFESMTVPRNQAVIDRMLEQEAAFWDLIQRDVEPPYDGSGPTLDALRRIPVEPGKVFDLEDEHGALVVAVRQAKAETARLRRELKAAEAVEKQAIGAIQVLMKDAEVARFEGEDVCSWKAQTRASYVVQESTFRTFRLL